MVFLKCVTPVAFGAGKVDDAFIIGGATAWLVDPLTVDALMHGNHITGLSDFGGRRWGLEEL